MGENGSEHWTSKSNFQSFDDPFISLSMIESKAKEGQSLFSKLLSLERNNNKAEKNSSSDNYFSDRYEADQQRLPFSHGRKSFGDDNKINSSFRGKGYFEQGSWSRQ